MAKLVKSGFWRLSPPELRAIGLSPKSKRYVSFGGLITAELSRVLPIQSVAKFFGLAGVPETISQRQYVQTINRQEGAPATKEARTRQLATGKAQYRSDAARRAVETRKRREPIRASLRRKPEGMSAREHNENIAIIDKWQRLGWKGLTKREQRLFRGDAETGQKGFFELYPREEVFDALGSPPTK